jgi:hypothetical protein
MTENIIETDKIVFKSKLPAHNSDQVRQLNNPLTERRRLKRQWPTDLSLT